ncbi:hypothetical protein MARCHEWKA_03180 [Brevundimonas phage vB_BpoS-Marchewka]|uniref:Uncharacterized protein n=1 Tax=Brevundimonas phage vB_BpoS-Marchewka TaxID=2948604 RepID=A0A9E7N4C8_9CAUD|nr:hypothetical protein MARCHEWKA_03180 [Brevundimonas phage vB_BpoS-Marchewka]UTC29277.1 hypothetical protein BAMBUS_01950 [Brevundimonas phage vB_BpoS-Bambus]
MYKTPTSHEEFVAQEEAGKAAMAAATPEQRALIADVQAYAQAHYEDGGWDFVLECWYDHDIFPYLVAAAFDLDKAIEAIGRSIGVVDDYRKDIQGA